MEMEEAPDSMWQRIDALLDAVWDLDPAEQSAFLDEACAGLPDLRTEVESLLAAEARAPDFLDGDAASFAGPAYARAFGGEAVPRTRRIGPYRLLDEIGRGGMSRIFRAERVDGAFEHEVAVKLLRLGLDSEVARRRFRLEQQVLATLQHPNIAQLLDGGLTDDDVPYLVMEHVDGVPITEYCAAHGCAIDERLELLATVGEALQYAHRNLVVHRDLKPSNILITEDGTVQLLDFGIAKLLDADAAGFTVPATRTGLRPMTPAYAAPEQVRGEAVSAVTDVYQLGVLAYELFTGRRPYEAAERSPFEVERAVLKETPARPSTAARSSVSSDSSDAPSARRAEALRGDLDAIVMKALRTEPDERYASAEAFVGDLERYDAGRPVAARSPTAGYRMRKFVRRHTVGVVASVAAVLVGALFVLILIRQQAQTAQQRDRAQAEAQAAEQVTSYLVDLFEASDPASAQDAEVTAQQLLQRGEQRVDQLNDQPAVQAAFLDAMGRAHQGLGHYDTARAMMQRSLQLRRAAYGPRHPDVAESLSHLAGLYAEERHFEPALPLYREALSIRREVFGPDHPRTAHAMGGLAVALRNMNKPDSALTLARRVLTIYRRHRDRTHPDVLNAEHALAYTLRALGRYEEGASVYRRVLDKQMQRYGSRHPEVAATHNDLGYLLKKQGNYEAAARHYRKALDIRRAVLGPAHPKTTLIMQNLAGTLWEMERYDEVEAVLRERVRAIRSHAPTDSTRLGRALGGLGRFLAGRGRFADAIPPKRDVYRIYRARHGASALYTLCQGGELGALLKATGRGRAADSLLRRHHAALQARRDTILQHRDRYTRLDVQHNLRAMIDIFEQQGLTAWVQRYASLNDDYTPSDTG